MILEGNGRWLDLDEVKLGHSLDQFPVSFQDPSTHDWR